MKPIDTVAQQKFATVVDMANSNSYFDKQEALFVDNNFAEANTMGKQNRYNYPLSSISFT